MFYETYRWCCLQERPEKTMVTAENNFWIAASSLFYISIGDCRLNLPTPNNPCKFQITHQTLYSTASDFDVLSVGLTPNPAGTVKPAALTPYMLDLLA
jgi:hypothetical protein